MTKRSTVDFSMDDDLGLARPPDRRLITSDNFYPGPPGVGPADTEFNLGKTSPSNNWIAVSSNTSRDPRLARSTAKSPTSEKPKQLFDKLGIPISPERSKKIIEARKSENKRRSTERERSRERSRSRSPKRERGRDRYREERYDREREDRYRRKRRSPSPPAPLPQHQSSREQQFQQPQQFAPNPQQYMAQPPPPMYNDGNYQTYPPQYVQQVPVQPPPQSFGGYEGFMQNPPPYVQSYPTAPPQMLNQPSVAPQTQAETPTQQLWHTTNQDSSQAADQIKREAAIASEMRQQKATLRKQREEYLRKQGVLKRELQVLKDQRSELKGSSRVPPSPDSQRFLKENAKLQLEIGNKLKTINNVIDMLSGIIGEDRGTPDATRISMEARSPDSSPDRLTRQIMDNLRDANPVKKLSVEAVDSPKESSRHSEKQQYNYIHYDPEMHWCQICDIFPKTAKEFLNHLHTREHEENVESKKIQEAPWHLQECADEELPVFPGAASKRLPIRGLQHFTPSTAWFCKLCNKWMGDLHCASLHLKSKNHAKSYNSFVEQNPHWETDWMADRQKSYERIRSSETTQPPQAPIPVKLPTPVPEVISEKGKKKKSKKEKKQKKKSKKRKKSSSSDSSGSSTETEDSDQLTDKANSIRVAMRNKLKAQAAEILLVSETVAAGKWLEVNDKGSGPKLEEKRPERPEEEKFISNWISNKGVSENDKKMFETLRNRIKLRQESNDTIKDKNVSKADGDRETFDTKREEHSRDRDRDRDRERDRDKDYHRDNERGYDRGYYRRPYDNRHNRYDKPYNNRSPDRKRYRSRSPNMERKSRVEVGVITNPPPAPKPPKFDKKIKSDDQSDNPSKPKPKVLVSTTLSSKKLPFIGRMPVFKLKKSDNSPKDSSSDDLKPSSLDTAKQRRDAINAQIQKAMEIAGLKVPIAPPPPSMHHIMPDGFNMAPMNMMHDPSVYDLAPPPPPILHYEQAPVSNFAAAITLPAPPPPIHDDLPPGISESSEVEAIKLQSAKSNKKPLPKDFEDALDIIFPDENKKPEKAAVMQVMADLPPPMMYNIDMSAQYGYHPEMYAMQQADFENVGFIQQPEVELMAEHEQEELMPEPPPEIVGSSTTEMDDLAMLGINESDITAQGF